MDAPDLTWAVHEAEETLHKLDEARKSLDAMVAEVHRWAETQAEAFVLQYVDEDHRAEAQALVARAVRIADEVGTWAVQRSPWGLAERLIPEFQAAAHEVEAFLAAPKRAASQKRAGNGGGAGL